MTIRWPLLRISVLTSEMLKFALVFAFFCAQAYSRPGLEIEPFVYGGTIAEEGEFPYTVSLIKPSGDVFCGGALISNKHILTAASCVCEYSKKTSHFIIGAGSVKIDSQELLDVSKVVLHPLWAPWNPDFDIAVVTLQKPVKFSNKIKTIALPNNEDLSNKTVTLSGWGASASAPVSKVLRYLSRRALTLYECNKKHSEKIFESQLCWDNNGNFRAGPMDVGGPVTYKGSDKKEYLGAVVSAKISKYGHFPDVFVKVSFYRDWVKQNMV